MKFIKCVDCGEIKPITEFYSDKTKTSGHKSYCKECASKRAVKFKKAKGSDYSKDIRLKSTYGISLEEYNRMFQQQEGCCAICGTHQSNVHRSLAVDHDHRTGKVRALLCHKCNAALGNVNDSIDILKEMISYINRHSS